MDLELELGPAIFRVEFKNGGAAVDGKARPLYEFPGYEKKAMAEKVQPKLIRAWIFAIVAHREPSGSTVAVPPKAISGFGSEFL